MTKLRRPCANCPWRKDAPRNYWDPTHFTDIWNNCQDDGARVMGCHKSTETKHVPCQGWIRVMGFDAIGVRILVMTDKVTMAEVEDTKGPELFKTFAEMLKANKIKLPKRNKFTR
jgi:hypothetical protein